MTADFSRLLVQHRTMNVLQTAIVSQLRSDTAAHLHAFYAALQYYVRRYAVYCYSRSSVVCRSVSLYLCHDRKKTAEPIEMPFGLWTRVGPRKHVLDEGADWPHLTNTTEPPMSGGDAAFLSNYFYHLLTLSQSYCALFNTHSAIQANSASYS